MVVALALAAGLAAALALLDLWRTGRAPQPPAADPRVGTRAAEQVRIEDADELRSPLAALPAQPPAEAVSLDEQGTRGAPGLRPGELVGRVLDPAGRPLPGVHVALERRIAGQLELLDPDAARATEPAGETTTDAQGEFRFVLERGVPVLVRARGAGALEAVAAERYAGQRVELVLAPASLVHGRILRERDGAPVEGACVTVSRLGGPPALSRSTQSAADGGYELRFPFAEDALLEVLPRAERSPAPVRLELGPDGTLRLDVLVPEGILATGRVTNAESGAPIAGASVGEGWRSRRWATTDAAGEYRLSVLGDPSTSELLARAPGHAQARLAHLPAPVEGVLRADFALARGRLAHGRVIDPAGAPLPGAYVAAVATESGRDGQEIDWIAGTTDARGRFRLGGLEPSLRHVLLAHAPGWSTHVLDFPPSGPEAWEIDLGDVVLTPPALVAGRVEDPDGRPQAGFTVSLRGANADRGRLGGAAPPGLVDFYVAERAVRSDAAGRFAFGGVAAGSYALTARRYGWAPAVPLAIEVAEGIDREDLVLVVDRGAEIRGACVDEEGRPVAGVSLQAGCNAPDDPASRQGVHMTRTDAEGAFAFPGLVPGTYRLDVLELPPGDPDAPWLPATVEDVRSGTAGLVLELERGATIRGTVLDATGPLPGLLVQASIPGRERRADTTTDGQGRFTLAVPRGSLCELHVRRPLGSGDFLTVLLARAGVSAGTQDLVLRLEE